MHCKLNQLYLQKLHSDILSIMDEIHRICVKYNIRYYMVGGTLLGAMRHHGFIPWDDDFDIGMTRDDYNKFITVCETELAERFDLICYDRRALYPRIFAKVQICGTVFDEGFTIDGKQIQGVFVDIFPLDYSDAYGNKLKIIKATIDRMLGIKWYKAHPSAATLPKKVIAKLVPIEFANWIISIFCSFAGEKDSGYLVNFGSQYGVKRQNMPKEFYGDGIDMQFEDRTYRGPDRPNDVLNSIYGSNYMEVPPPEKRRTHYPRRVVFSDGTEYRFERPAKTVSVLETL